MRLDSCQKNQGLQIETSPDWALILSEPSADPPWAWAQQMANQLGYQCADGHSRSVVMTVSKILKTSQPHSDDLLKLKAITLVLNRQSDFVLFEACPAIDKIHQDLSDVCFDILVDSVRFR